MAWRLTQSLGLDRGLYDLLAGLPPRAGFTANKPESTALRLVSGISCRSHVSVDKSIPHIIIGWANEDGIVKSIEDEPPALISPEERR